LLFCFSLSFSYSSAALIHETGMNRMVFGKQTIDKRRHIPGPVQWLVAILALRLFLTLSYEHDAAVAHLLLLLFVYFLHFHENQKRQQTKFKTELKYRSDFKIKMHFLETDDDNYMMMTQAIFLLFFIPKMNRIFLSNILIMIIHE